jgi:hypothetical protein
MRFFVLQNIAGSSHDVELRMVKPKVGAGLSCPACGRSLTEQEWLPPFQAELKLRGQALGDVVFAPGMDFLVSERFLEAWRAERLSGLFGLKEVEILKIRPKRAAPKDPPRFFLALAGYGMTQLDERQSEITREGQVDCGQCMGGAEVKAISRLMIDVASWSGEDIFVPWGLRGYLMASERVLALRDKYGLTNINLAQADDLSI